MRLPAVVLMLLALLLTGCGFRLAGSRPLPAALQTVYIDVVAPYRVSEPPVESSLRAILQRRGAQVLVAQEPGAALIRLSELKEEREVLSIGVDGKALEFRLVTRVRYELMQDGRPLLEPGTLVATRDYSFQPEQVLAKEAEEARLREFIQNELAELLMLRFEVQLTRPAAAAPATAGDAAPAP
ncbi:MAG TPA: LPS assembly lipoprotein LptE [Solimonas sp.]|nr:LPS assembly lipoprotein LptE [Solimonas sp.]